MDQPGTVDFACPFCGGYVHASVEEEHVIHIAPACQKFMDLEPDDFLHECNVVFVKIRDEKGAEAARLMFKLPPSEGRS